MNFFDAMSQEIRIEERRLYERISMRLDGRIQLPGDSEASSVAFINFGPHGFCFLSSRHFDAGADLRVRLALDAEETILNTQVVWEQKTDGGGYRIGVNILGGSRYDEEKFISFYAEKLLMARL